MSPERPFPRETPDRLVVTLARIARAVEERESDRRRRTMAIVEDHKRGGGAK